MMIRGYIRLMFFAIGMLAGLQIPAFVQLYAQRTNAHYLEVQQNFAGFQKIADRHFSGDVQAMIQHHERSGDKVFIEGGENIQAMYDRLMRFAKEDQAMKKSLHEAVWHVVSNADSELLQETRSNYDYTVPINVDAAVYGVVIGVVIALVFDFLWLLLAGIFGVKKHSRAR